MTTAPVSIALVTRNGEATLPSLLDAVRAQRIGRPIEIVAVDSGSTDATRRILAAADAQIVDVDPRAFNHGLTRNVAVQRCSGDLVVLIVQDAIPTSDQWLVALIEPLLRDASIAGTFARQLPRPDAGAITRHYLAQWVAAGETAFTAAVADEAAWQRLTPEQRFLRAVFDNVCSCVRRSVWAEHPFAATPIAEDIQWGRDVLLAGYQLAFAPGAAVIHSHERSAHYEFRRTYVLHRRLWDLFGLRTIPTVGLAARAAVSSAALHLRCEGLKLGRWPRAAALAVAWPAGQYFGARSGALGRPEPKWRPGTV